MAKKYADTVVKIAKNESGYLEKKSNKFLSFKTKNAGKNNYTKYGNWYGLNPAYWCAEFVSWSFNKAYKDCDLIYGKSASCEVIRQHFIKKERYSKTPKVGSLIFFSGSRHSGANHIGIVTKVSTNHVWTVEGNTSSENTVVDNGGAVAVKCYKRGYSRILGYGHPKYDTRTKTTNAKKKKYGGAFPILPKKGYLSKGDEGAQVKNVQAFLNWAVGAKLKVDGKYGDNTSKAVSKFQKIVKIESDGAFGKKTLSKAKKYKK